MNRLRQHSVCTMRSGFFCVSSVRGGSCLSSHNRHNRHCTCLNKKKKKLKRSLYIEVFRWCLTQVIKSNQLNTVNRNEIQVFLGEGRRTNNKIPQKSEIFN